MKSFTRTWLREEAGYQGLPLDDADLDAVYAWVTRAKNTLAALRAREQEGSREDELDSSYQFRVPKENRCNAKGETE